MSDMCTDNPMSCYSSFSDMKTYTVTDLKVRPYYGGWIADRKEIKAATPIEAVRKYLKNLGLENFKVKRNYEGNGRCFVGKYGYDIICP